METILLTSDGMQMADYILKLLNKPASETKIGHIITAAKNHNPAPWMEKDKKKMLELGFNVEDIDIEGKTEKELEEILSGKDIIYVQGGSPYYLLKHLKVSGFENAVRRLISKGTIYIGASAGSYITCPTIEQALWKKPHRNRYGLRDDEPAMGLVPFLVLAHYEPQFEEAVKAGIAKSKYPVKILADGQAILVRDGKTTFIGNEITLNSSINSGSSLA